MLLGSSCNSVETKAERLLWNWTSSCFSVHLFFAERSCWFYLPGVGRRNGTAKWPDIFWPLVSWRSGTPSEQTTKRPRYEGLRWWRLQSGLLTPNFLFFLVWLNYIQGDYSIVFTGLSQSFKSETRGPGAQQAGKVTYDSFPEPFLSLWLLFELLFAFTFFSVTLQIASSTSALPAASVTPQTQVHTKKIQTTASFEKGRFDGWMKSWGLIRLLR